MYTTKLNILYCTVIAIYGVWDLITISSLPANGFEAMVLYKFFAREHPGNISVKHVE